jgi:20S proteasome alpha/beta subunit
LIVGYSGFRRTFELFRNDLADYITTYKSAYHANPTIYKINSQIAEIIFKLNNRYHGESFDLLVAISGVTTLENRSRLIHFYPDGTMQSVIDCKSIGTGAPYGSIFLKQNWHQDMTMKEVAELGYFIIKYIERYNLDLSVGVNTDKPQVWFIPDREVDHSADSKLLDEYEENTRKHLERIEQYKLHKLF